MKKQFLTLALMATVAVGGAFANSISSTSTGLFVQRGGVCEEAIDLEENCIPNGPGLHCTAESTINNQRYPAYHSNPDNLECDIEYKRQN